MPPKKEKIKSATVCAFQSKNHACYLRLTEEANKHPFCENVQKETVFEKSRGENVLAGV